MQWIIENCSLSHFYFWVPFQFSAKHKPIECEQEKTAVLMTSYHTKGFAPPVMAPTNHSYLRQKGLLYQHREIIESDPILAYSSHTGG